MLLFGYAFFLIPDLWFFAYLLSAQRILTNTGTSRISDLRIMLRFYKEAKIQSFFYFLP